MLDDLYMRILDMSAVASVVILVVLFARLLLKRAPKVFSYALWAVVLFRLLCPISFAETTVSLIPEITPAAETYDLNDEPISVLGAGRAAYRAVGDALNGGLGVQRINTTDVEPDGSYRAVTTDWYDVCILFGQYVWVAGVAWMLLRSGISYRKLRKQIEVAIPLRENIYLADDLQSPFVVGLIHTKIYLPSNLSDQEQVYIILHEQHHIRRGDHVIKALAFLALCLHWFNPLVWLAFHLASKDMEMSCDEAVVRNLGDGIRADYSASLLTLATGRRIIAGTPLAFGEGDPKGRIRNLAKWKKPALWVTILAVVLCTVLGVCLLTDPAEKDVIDGYTWYSGTIVDSGMSAAVEGDAEERAYITLQCGDENRTIWLLEGTEALDGVIGEYWVVRSLIDPDTGLLTMLSMHASQPKYQASLDEAIYQGILDHNYAPRNDGLCQTASFQELAKEADGQYVTVYGLSYYSMYALEEGILREDIFSHLPVAITFYITDSGEYLLTEYWQPRDGSYYADDIRAKFPLFVWPDTQAYVSAQIQECYSQAAAYFGLNYTSATANGFEIRLYTDRDIYTTEDEIHIWATLEYQGESDTVTIWHGRPYITFSITDGADFNTGGMVETILTSTELNRGEVYKIQYAKSGGYDPSGPDGEFWDNFYQEEALHLPAGTYTVTVNGAFSISEEQRPDEGGPSCELQITVTD